jgi:hypothetical protein
MPAQQFAALQAEERGEIHKFFLQRNSYFPSYEGVHLDHEGWYSVTPRSIARTITDKMVAGARLALSQSLLAGSRGDPAVLAGPAASRPLTFCDPMCGCGGNVISFASDRHVGRVLAIDMSPTRLLCAYLNAKANGVADKITFLLADSFAVAREHGPFTRGIDACFTSPPWGGVGYSRKVHHDLLTDPPFPLPDVARLCASFSQNFCLLLPRNIIYTDLWTAIPGTVAAARDTCAAICRSLGREPTPAEIAAAGAYSPARLAPLASALALHSLQSYDPQPLGPAHEGGEEPATSQLEPAAPGSQLPPGPARPGPDVDFGGWRPSDQRRFETARRILDQLEASLPRPRGRPALPASLDPVLKHLNTSQMSATLPVAAPVAEAVAVFSKRQDALRSAMEHPSNPTDAPAATLLPVPFLPTIEVQENLLAAKRKVKTITVFFGQLAVNGCKVYEDAVARDAGLVGAPRQGDAILWPLLRFCREPKGIALGAGQQREGITLSLAERRQRAQQARQARQACGVGEKKPTSITVGPATL